VRDRDVAKPEQAERAGGEGTRDSIVRKMAGGAGERGSRAGVRAVTHPTSFPFTIAYTAMTNDAVTVTAPATSRRCAAVATRAPGTTKTVRTTTRIPTGTLTRKIQCQSSASVRIPPRRTPSEPPPEATKPKTPIAFVRSAGSRKRVIISERATAETTAPPTPATARAAISIPCEFANPHSAEAAVKRPTPARNIVR